MGEREYPKIRFYCIADRHSKILYSYFTSVCLVLYNFYVSIKKKPLQVLQLIRVQIKVPRAGLEPALEF